MKLCLPILTSAFKSELFLITIFTIIMITLTTASAGVSVIIPSENTVSSSRIILGDISTIAPDTPSDQNLANLIENIDLGPSPTPGSKITLRRRQLEQKLSSSGIPVSDIQWMIPDEITLIRNGQNLQEDFVKKIILEYLERSEPYQNGHFEIISLTSANPPSLPPGQVEYHFTPLPTSNPGYLSGTIIFIIGDKEIGRLRTTVQIDLQMPALVASRDLPRGHILSEEDLAESLISYSLSKGALTETSQALGQTLKVNLKTGSAIKGKDLIQSYMVKKGETVTIVAQSGGLTISALGQAKQDGTIGQTISIINQDSKKTISARVIGPGKVEVNF